MCGASAASHEVGARNAIESFTKEALEMWRGPLVTILARNIRLKIEIFRARLVTLLALDIVEEPFNRISPANIVTSATRNISKAWSTSKNFQLHFLRQYRD